MTELTYGEFLVLVIAGGVGWLFALALWVSLNNAEAHIRDLIHDYRRTAVMTRRIASLRARGR